MRNRPDGTAGPPSRRWRLVNVELERRVRARRHHASSACVWLATCSRNGRCLVDAEVIGDGVHLQEPKDEQRGGDHADECERKQNQVRESVGRGVLCATCQPPGLCVSRERFGGHPTGYYATIRASARVSAQRMAISRDSLTISVGCGRRRRFDSPRRVAALPPAPGTVNACIEVSCARWAALPLAWMAREMDRVLWRQSLEMHLRAARIHEDAAERFTRVRDFARATGAAEFAAAERRAHAEASARHPEWAP